MENTIHRTWKSFNFPTLCKQCFPQFHIPTSYTTFPQYLLQRKSFFCSLFKAKLRHFCQCFCHHSVTLVSRRKAIGHLYHTIIRIYNLVLFPQTGQRTHSALLLISIRYLTDNTVKVNEIPVGIIPNSLKLRRVFNAIFGKLIIIAKCRPRHIFHAAV